jgi:hypothetical protein
MEQNDDTISSLMRELEKYRFGEEEESFEKHMKKCEKQGAAMFLRNEASVFGMDEETVFEII